MQRFDSEYYENVFADVESGDPLFLRQQMKRKSPMELMQELNRQEHFKLKK